MGDVQFVAHRRVGVGQPAAQFLQRAHDQRERGAELVADVGEERGLRLVQLGQLLGPPLLRPVAAGAADARGDVSGDQFHEGPVTVVERPVPVQRGHQESVGRAALPGQRYQQRLGRRRVPGPVGQLRRAVGEGGQVDGLGALARSGGGPQGGLAGRQGEGRDEVARLDAAGAGQADAAVAALGALGHGAGVGPVVEEVGEGERQVLRVAAELAGGEVQHLLLGAHHAGVGPQVAQGGHAPLADDPLRLLGDHAEHADDLSGVVPQRAVGEGVIRLLAVTGAFQEQLQPLVPGGPAGGQDGADARADGVPDLRPHLAGGPPERPRVLLSQRVVPVGVVAEERQFRAPRHPHREPGGEQDAHRRAQALRPVGRGAQRGRRPVDRGQVAPDLRVGGEHVRPGRRGTTGGEGACHGWAFRLDRAPVPERRARRRMFTGTPHSFHRLRRISRTHWSFRAGRHRPGVTRGRRRRKDHRAVRPLLPSVLRPIRTPHQETR